MKVKSGADIRHGTLGIVFSMGVVMALGHISRYRHAPTHRYRPKIPSSNIQEGI